MVTNFFATTVDDWDDPAGVLHAYLVPEPNVRARLAPALEAVGEVPFLAAQPLEGLHATIVRLPVLVRNLADDDASLVMATATESGTALGPITLRFGSPHVTPNSLLVSAPGGERWDALVALVRDAAAQVPGVDANRHPPPWAPHITLAYATSDGEDDVIRSALSATPGATNALNAVTFTKIAWCGVHQNRDAGTYTFDVLFETPLGHGSVVSERG